jgi:hypothetical protein
MARDLLSGRMHSSVDFRIIYTYPTGDLAYAALERLADLAIEPVIRSSLRVEALRVRAKFELWDAFELKTRLAWRGLRNVSDARGPLERPSLIWRSSKDVGVEVRRTHARDIALCYGRYLWKTGRSQQALRVLYRLSKADLGLGKHLAQTLMGLIRLDFGDREGAVTHFAESVAVDDDMWLHLAGHSRELLEALDRGGVFTPEVRRARERLLRAPVPF